MCAKPCVPPGGGSRFCGQPPERALIQLAPALHPHAPALQDELPGGSPSVGTAQEAEDCVSAGSAPGDACGPAPAPAPGQAPPGGAQSAAGKPLPGSPPRRVLVQSAHTVPSPAAAQAPGELHCVSLLPPGHLHCPSSPFASPAAAAALGLHQRSCSRLSCEERPASPEELVCALPAEAVPLPPPAAVAAFGRLVGYCLPPHLQQLQQLGSLGSLAPVSAPSTTAAMHHHRGILLHPQPSVYSAASPFAAGPFASGFFMG